MPQDVDLYGQRPTKKRKPNAPISTSLDFTSQLASLVSAPTSSSSTGRQRPSKRKDDEFSAIKIKRRDHPASEARTNPTDTTRLRLKSPLGTEDDANDRARAKRKMEQKARLYAAMKRGDHVAKEGEAAPLVDFDRKWAERQAAGHASSDSDSDSDVDDGYKDTEVIEYEDEFGRMRRGTRAEKDRQERRRARGLNSATELNEMSARPKAPEGVIFGDAVQAEAFRPDDPEAMARLAAKRDRSATPPPETHYDGGAEIRTRGTGFYQFSTGDEERRKEEMAGLAAERAATEKARSERAEKLEARKREVEQRRKEIGERRAKKMADNFLDGLGMELGTGKGAEQEN